MTLLAAWVLFPLILAGISLGCGLATARLSRTPIHPALLLPVGYAGAVVLGLFTTLSERTARLTVPTVLAVGALGLASSLPWRRPSVDPWLMGAALLVFAAFAAPVVLSGEATFAGYVKLDDTATFLAIVDRALEHGRSLDGLAPSSYEATLAFNLHFYPLGSLLPLGVGSALTGQDPAWLFQPYLAFLAALLALVLYQLAGLVVGSRALRLTAAVLGSQAALLYGYALWGGVKELAAAALVALIAALTGSLFPSNRRGLAVVPLAVAGAALVGVLSIGAAAWLLPALLICGVTLLRRGGSRKPLLLAGAVAGLVIPSLAVAKLVLAEGVLGSIRDSQELGNLIAPLSPLQLAGIWPSGDFRVDPGEMAPALLLVAAAFALALAGLFLAISRRAWEMALYGASVLGAAGAFAVFGSPWVEAKAFAIGSPALVFGAALGAIALLGRGRRVEGIVALAAIALGVLWSNALAFREVNLAPRAQLAELEEIGESFAGTGPALMTEYQPYGVRHFLRGLDAEGASELRRRQVPLQDGSLLPKGGFADITAFRQSDLLAYRTLVLRRSPVAGVPPAPYRLVWSRKYYEVWQRPQAYAISDVRAQRCGRGAVVRQLAGVPATTSVTVPREGRYELWIGGSVRGRLEVKIDGRLAATAQHQLSHHAQYVPLGQVTLGAGTHTVRIELRRPKLAPGSGGQALPIGPLALTPAGACPGNDL